MYIDLHADVTCRLMLDVLRRPSSAPPPPAMTSPARASTWISKACKAGLGGPDVAAHSGSIEEHWNSLQLESERWPVAVQLTP
jgi:hypothetical protein